MNNGFPVDFFADLVADIDENGPGFAAGFWSDQQAPQYFTHGCVRIGGAMIDAHTNFDIASVSKMFTALCVGILAREYKVSYEDLLGDLIPEMRNAAPHVRLRHLMHHTSALPDYMELFAQKGLHSTDRLGMQQTLEILSQQPPAPMPGQEFSYSNSGYVLLSAVIERVTGLTTAQFMHENIFAPLGMKTTRLVDRMPPDFPDLAQSYDNIDNGLTMNTEVNPLWDMTGDGQIYSNLNDLGLWVKELMSPIVFADILPNLMKCGTFDDGSALNYGAGFIHEYENGQHIIGHDGGWAGFRSSLLILPDTRQAVIILSNRADFETGELAMKVAKACLG